MLQWGAERRVDLHFIEPGKPTQNAKIESLNGKIRDELLNAHLRNDRRGSRPCRCLEKGLQRDAPAFIARRPDAAGVREQVINLEPTLLHALDENRNDVRYNWFHRRFWRLVAPVHGGANECRGD